MKSVLAVSTSWYNSVTTEHKTSCQHFHVGAFFFAPYWMRRLSSQEQTVLLKPPFVQMFSLFSLHCLLKMARCHDSGDVSLLSYRSQGFFVTCCFCFSFINLVFVIIPFKQRARSVIVIKVWKLSAASSCRIKRGRFRGGSLATVWPKCQC